VPRYYTNLEIYSLLHTYAIWYSLLLLGYKPVQHVAVGIVTQWYYNIMAPPSYTRSVVGRNIVMRRMTVLSRLHISSCARDHSLQTLVTMSHSLLVTVTAITKRAFSVRYAPYTLVVMATVVTKLCGTGPKKQLSVENTIEYSKIRWQHSNRRN